MEKNKTIFLAVSAIIALIVFSGVAQAGLLETFREKVRPEFVPFAVQPSGLLGSEKILVAEFGYGCSRCIFQGEKEKKWIFTSFARADKTDLKDARVVEIDGVFVFVLGSGEELDGSKELQETTLGEYFEKSKRFGGSKSSLGPIVPIVPIPIYPPVSPVGQEIAVRPLKTFSG